MWRVKTIILAGILFLLQTEMAMASDRIEKQSYKVVLEEKEFEIRHYPPATLATIYSSAQTYRELSGSGFRRLAGYIFGGNESNKKIAMTSPVHMDINDTRSSMSFVMPSEYEIGDLPEPNDAGVVVQQTSDEFVAAIRFKGYASDKDIRRYSERLKELLTEKGIEYHGNFRYLGYNPPYQFIGRKNEIIVNVSWRGVE